MGRFVEGQDRRHSWLLPSSLDDYVTADIPVRVVEAFIDELDLGALGFTRFEAAATGRPAYDPATLLKLYLYGYLNRVPSTEKFERFKSWKHKTVLEAMQRRLDDMPDAMAVRRAAVEHVFGTLEAWMSSTLFLTKGLKGVRTEMSLATLAYNMKRMIRLFGAT